MTCSKDEVCEQGNEDDKEDQEVTSEFQDPTCGTKKLISRSFSQTGLND